MCLKKKKKKKKKNKKKLNFFFFFFFFFFGLNYTLHHLRYKTIFPFIQQVISVTIWWSDAFHGVAEPPIISKFLHKIPTLAKINILKFFFFFLIFIFPS
jgi:hypothetical protein